MIYETLRERVLDGECERLRRENVELKKLNGELADALAGQVSVGLRNTDMIIGAMLSGGDPMALAKRLIKKPKKLVVTVTAKDVKRAAKKL